MGCGASIKKEDTLSKVFERKLKKASSVHNDLFFHNNMIMPFDYLQCKWADQVVSNITATSLHILVTNQQVSLVSYLSSEIGHEIKPTILLACRFLVQKCLYDVEKLRSRPGNQQIVSTMIQMLDACKKYYTILTKKYVDSKQLVKLPFLLICFIAELYHVFVSICNMIEGTEAQIWWYFPEIDGDIELFTSYSNYLESRTGPVAAYGSQTIIVPALRRSKKLKAIVFDKNCHYIETFQNSVFDLFSQEIENGLKEYLLLYKTKPKIYTVVTEHECEMKESKRMLSSKYSRYLNDSLTGTLLSFSQMEEPDAEMQLEIADEEDMPVGGKQLFKAKRNSEYIISNGSDFDFDNDGLEDMETNTHVENLTPSMSAPVTISPAQSFTACQTFRYFESAN